MSSILSNIMSSIASPVSSTVSSMASPVSSTVSSMASPVSSVMSSKRKPLGGHEIFPCLGRGSSPTTSGYGSILIKL
jgi:hypothetical protein